VGPLPSPQPLASNVPPPPGLAPGTRLGRYEVVSELGTGGMATVYLGRALAAAGFQRLVAIKVLHPHLLRDEQFVQMFLDEGRLAARIHHPNVVATVDLEHTAQGLYIVSEYIEGDILLGLYKAARAQEKRIPFGVSLRVMLDALAGLHAAHELADDLGNPLKIIHRDVSPHNILVGSDGIARITDFGIAKAEERISTTRDGIVKGKLSYMAPEQPNDLPIDRRVDIFSAATVLWECLTGRRLFPGKTDGEVLQALLHKPITRLREVDPTLSPALDDVLARALSRDPDARFDTAADFADALEHAAAPQGIANARVVAQYVKDVAGAKITAEHERRRLTTRDLPLFRGTPSQVRPIERGSVPPPGPTSDAPPAPPARRHQRRAAVSAQHAVAPVAACRAPAAVAGDAHGPGPAAAARRRAHLHATARAPAPARAGRDAGAAVGDDSVARSAAACGDVGAARAQHRERRGPDAAPVPRAHPRRGHPRATPVAAAHPRGRSPGHAAVSPEHPVGPAAAAAAPRRPHERRRLGAPAPARRSRPPRSVVPSFVTPAHEGHEATVQGVAPPPAPAVSAPPPPPPPPPAGATPSAPADVPPDTVRDLSLAATTAMAAIAPIPPPAAEATPPTPAAPLTPGATTVADDDDAAPTLLAIPAPPGMGRPSRKPAEAPLALATPAVPAPAVPAPAFVAPPRPVVQARVGTGSHTPAEGRRRGPLVVGVVALGVLLGYGIWSFTGPASAPVEPHAASPAVVYPAARAAEPPASPPPMADPAPAQPEPAPVQPEPAPAQPVAATPPAAPMQPPAAPAQPVAAPSPPSAPVARPAVVAAPPAPAMRPAVVPTTPVPLPVARPAVAPAPAPEPSTGTAAPPPVLPAPSAEPPALPTTI
jgi:hypothetical protein